MVVSEEVEESVFKLKLWAFGVEVEVETGIEIEFGVVFE